MSVSPRDFLSLAEFSQQSTEVIKRNAISRSYYAAFHAAERVRIARKLDLPDIKSGSHLKLCVALERSGEESLAAIGADLNRQRLVRLEADYDLEKTIGFNVAKRNTDKNKELFDQLSSKLGSSEDVSESYGS